MVQIHWYHDLALQTLGSLKEWCFSLAPWATFFFNTDGNQTFCPKTSEMLPLGVDFFGAYTIISLLGLVWVFCLTFFGRKPLDSLNVQHQTLRNLGTTFKGFFFQIPGDPETNSQKHLKNSWMVGSDESPSGMASLMWANMPPDNETLLMCMLIKGRSCFHMFSLEGWIFDGSKGRNAGRKRWFQLFGVLKPTT